MSALPDLLPGERIIDDLIVAESELGRATFSLDRRFRYGLQRWLTPRARAYETQLLRVLAVIMVNPSDADAFKNDPTIADLIKRATLLGADVLDVGNLFALRSPDPRALDKCGSAEHAGHNAINDLFIRAAADRAFMTIAAWGGQRSPVASARAHPSAGRRPVRRRAAPPRADRRRRLSEASARARTTPHPGRLRAGEVVAVTKCDRCRQPFRRRPGRPRQAQCASCLAERAEYERARYAGTRVPYTPLDSLLEQPAIRLLRALRWFDWVDGDDLYELAGAPEGWENRQDYHQALSRLVRGRRAERQLVVVRMASWVARINRYRITDIGRRELARRLTVDMGVATDKEASAEVDVAA